MVVVYSIYRSIVVLESTVENDERFDFWKLLFQNEKKKNTCTFLSKNFKKAVKLLNSVWVYLVKYEISTASFFRVFVSKEISISRKKVLYLETYTINNKQSKRFQKRKCVKKCWFLHKMQRRFCRFSAFQKHNTAWARIYILFFKDCYRMKNALG